MERSASMPQQRATSANYGLPLRIGTSPRLVFDTFRFVTSIAEQSRAKSFGHAERRQAFSLCDTEYELRYGVEKSQKSEKNLAILNDFLAYLNIIPFDSLSSSIAASIRCKLEKKGEMIGPYDLLIASQAIANDYTLVTNNEREFKRIKDLKIENWI
jgi:tRNA(fMet)-specific endonuclease VapC